MPAPVGYLVFDAMEPERLTIGFQRVPEGRSGKSPAGDDRAPTTRSPRHEVAPSLQRHAHPLRRGARTARGRWTLGAVPLDLRGHCLSPRLCGGHRRGSGCRKSNGRHPRHCLFDPLVRLLPHSPVRTISHRRPGRRGDGGEPLHRRHRGDRARRSESPSPFGGDRGSGSHRPDLPILRACGRGRTRNRSDRAGSTRAHRSSWAEGLPLRARRRRTSTPDPRA